MSTGTMPRSRTGRSTPLIDPRLRDRRIEVARHEGRRRLRRILAAVAVVALVVGAAALTQSPLLDVDVVAVSGTANTDAAVVRSVAAVDRGTPMVAVDTGQVASRLEGLPWVASASVVRRWPGTVAIRIVERRPVATIGTGAAAVLVDGDGRVLGPAGSVAGLPQVAGDPAPAGELVAAPRRVAVAVVAELPGELRREVARAAPVDGGTILTLDDGITVRWGDRSQSSAKAEALQVVLDARDRATIASIDVTVPRATTVTPA